MSQDVDDMNDRLLSFPFNCSQTFREIRCWFVCVFFFSLNDVLKSLVPFFLF